MARKTTQKNGNDLKETANKVWLAGLGALATAGEEGGKLFDKLAARWREKDYRFPYLHDEAQDVARAFGAVCTPDIFVFDEDRRLAYRGRIDDSWKDESRVTRRELAAALESLVAGKRPSPEQRPSMGCSIKWRQAA